jgi:hypothetical protein
VSFKFQVATFRTSHRWRTHISGIPDIKGVTSAMQSSRAMQSGRPAGADATHWSDSSDGKADAYDGSAAGIAS